MAALVDTNVLVYRFDARYPDKQRISEELLRHGIEQDSIQVPHQGILEFVAATTRPRRGAEPILDPVQARWEAELMVDQFPILYPNEEILRLALRGAAAYQLPWFDAHLWAYAEYFGLTEIYSEDFQNGRRYGTVRVVNPYLSLDP